MGGAMLSNPGSASLLKAGLAGKTLLPTYNGQNGLGYKLLRNPTAGKTYYLMAIGLWITSTVNAKQVSVMSDRNFLIVELVSKITPTYYTKDSQSTMVVFPIPIPIQRTTNGIEIIGTADTNSRAWIIGWEE